MARPEAPLGLLTHMAKLYRCMGYDRYAAPDVEHHVLRDYDRDRGINFLHPGRLRFFTLPLPGTGFSVYRAHCDHFPARRGNHYPNLYILPKNWLAGHLASLDRSRLLCECL